MSMNSRVDKIESQLNKGEFLKFRNYRNDKSLVTERFWQLMCMILLSSNRDKSLDDFFSPHDFLRIVGNFYDRVFLDIDKSLSNIREIPRKSGLNRALWKKHKEEFNALQISQNKVIREVELILRQSILTNKEIKIFIRQAEPELIPINLFDKWHVKLEQEVAPLLSMFYPQQLIHEYEDGTKLTSGIYLNKKLVSSYQELTKDAMIAFYIKALVDRIDWYFSEHNFDVYSEDLLTQKRD